MFRKTRKPKTSKVKKILISLLLAVLASTIYIAIYAAQTITPNATTTVPKGSTGIVIDSLSKQGYDVGMLDGLLIKLAGGLKYGKFELGDASYSRIGFYLALQDAKTMEIEVTLIPGETVEIFLHQIAEKHNLSYEKLKKSYYENTGLPDGVIFADTYTFRHDISEDGMMDYLIETGLKKHKELSQKLTGKYDEQTWFRKFVVIASIIQKEAVNEGEMPIVASVIYNRLAKGMPLQMDGSLNYGMYSHKKITPERIRTDNTTYNTYKNKGLPDYPICAVSKEALKAAVSPAHTDFLYFMRNTSGVHTFSKSFSQHTEVIESVKKSNRN